MKEPLLIGIHGKPRNGKDTVAKYLMKKLNLMRYGPSVRVKDTAAVMFDVPRKYFDDDNMKDQMDPFWKMTYRQMAQKVGKESSRDIFGDDIWMRHVEKKLQEIKSINIQASLGYSGIILPDIRYASEIRWIKEHGGSVLFVIRDDAPQTSDQGHVAEHGLSLDLADAVIYNNGTIEELHEQINALLAYGEG